jgi:hypothetical protein
MGKQLFISYKRHTDYDEPLAIRLYAALKAQGYEPFLDQSMPVGSHWPNRIHEALSASDFLVLLISEASIESSMVAEEVRMAQQGTPPSECQLYFPHRPAECAATR